MVFEVTGVQSAHDSDIVLWLAQLPGDVDQDGQVSVRDATLFGQAFAERESLLIDLNGDGRVDVRDATTFGAIWRGAPPATRPWNSSRLPDKPE